MIRNAAVVVVAASLQFLFAQGKVPDFTQEYKSMKPALGSRPLLVVLLEPDDPRDQGRVNVYGRRTNGCIYGSIVLTAEPEFRRLFYPPQSMQFKSAPTVVLAPDGSGEQVLALGLDGQVYATWTYRDDYGDWQPWTPLPGAKKLKSAPTAVNSPDGTQLWVFATGTDGQVYGIEFDRQAATWGNWQPLPQLHGGFSSSPAALVLNGGKRLSVFATHATGTVHQTSRDLAPGVPWSTWQPIQCPWKLRSAPAVALKPGGGRLTLFATDETGTIRQTDDASGNGHAWGAWKVVPSGIKFLAAPAAMYSPDGTLLLLFGWAEDSSYYRSWLPASPGASWTAWSALPTLWPLGSPPAVVSRLASRVPADTVRERLFGSTHSVRTYYRENSYNLFTFHEAAVTSWLTAQDDPLTSDWDESTWSFLHESPIYKKSAWLVQQVEKVTGFKFSDYDTSGDGLVTDDELAVMWVFTGETGGCVRGFDPDPVPVPSLTKGLSLAGLARVPCADGMVGTACHELAHVLGHTDLYSYAGYQGIDRFSLMGITKPLAHLDPWAKMKLGWLKPNVVTEDGLHTLRDVETHPDAYVLYSPARGPKEYFIVENRWPGSSHESALMDTGLAIWRIDETVPGKALTRETFHLVRAGKAGPEPENASKALWDGPYTVSEGGPASRWYPPDTRWKDGTPSNIIITQIPKAAPTIQVHFDVPQYEDGDP